MPCFRPLDAWRSAKINPDTGKRPMVFSGKYALDYTDVVKLPCGQCIGCRLSRSQQWAIRCVHEASLHENNCFLTLTYSDEDLAQQENPYSINVEHFQKFMKRLRKHFTPKNPYKKDIDPKKYQAHKDRYNIRFFHCGEYGGLTGRPHYHACIFNLDFPDKELWKIENDERLYISPTLDRIWGHGHCTIGDVTYQSAAYVARYVMKKITGDKAEEYYWKFDPIKRRYYELKPEYATMSRRPGLASAWFSKFYTDIYPADHVVLKGKILRPPKFYDTQLEKLDPFKHETIKQAREADAYKLIENNTPDRLAVREKIQLSRLEKLKRETA